MLEFREISLTDRDSINAALRKSDFQGCEYSFANNLAWRRLSNAEICLHGGFYFLKYLDKSGKPSFSFPAGEGDIRGLFGELQRIAEAENVPLRISSVTKRSLPMLNELFPEQFTAELDRNFCDYIYLRSDLADLPGKKFHQKRNHLARFRELDCEFSELTEKDFDDCIYYIAGTYNDKAGYSDHSAVVEQFAVNTFFNCFHELGLMGGVIRMGGKVVAVTIGEQLNSDTFCVHIEKAEKSVNGLYAGINNCFVRSCTDGFKYINREEDMGIEGLRRAKLSYHPAYLLEKYEITFK